MIGAGGVRWVSGRRRWRREGVPRACDRGVGRAGRRRDVRSGSAGARNRPPSARPEKCSHTNGAGPYQGVCELKRRWSVRRPDGLGRAGILEELEITDVLKLSDLRRRCVWRRARGLVGEPTVGEDLLDDVGLCRFDEAD